MSSSSEDFIDDIVSRDERRAAAPSVTNQQRVQTRSTRSADLVSNSSISAPRIPPDFSDEFISNLATPVPNDSGELPSTLQLDSLDRTARIYSESSSIEFSSNAAPLLPTILEEPHQQQLFTLEQVQQILLNSGIRPESNSIFQMPQRLGPFRSPSSNSSPSASSTSFIEPPLVRSPILSRIPEAEFPKTSTAQSKQLEEIKFSKNSSNNKKNLKSFNMLLSECKLLSMADGSRPLLVVAISNPFGYCANSVHRNSSGDLILVPHDDIFMRDHDRQRLFSMLHLSTSTDLHYLISSALEKKDAVDWYNILKTHPWTAEQRCQSSQEAS